MAKPRKIMAFEGPKGSDSFKVGVITIDREGRRKVVSVGRLRQMTDRTWQLVDLTHGYTWKSDGRISETEAKARVEELMIRATETQ